MCEGLLNGFGRLIALVRVLPGLQGRRAHKQRPACLQVLERMLHLLHYRVRVECLVRYGQDLRQKAEYDFVYDRFASSNIFLELFVFLVFRVQRVLYSMQALFVYTALSKPIVSCMSSLIKRDWVKKNESSLNVQTK